MTPATRNDIIGVDSTGQRDHNVRYKASKVPDIWPAVSNRLLLWLWAFAAIVIIGACFYAAVVML